MRLTLFYKLLSRSSEVEIDRYYLQFSLKFSALVGPIGFDFGGSGAG